MADLRIFHNSEPNVLVLNEKLPCSSDILESLWLPTSAPPFRGSRSMLNFENVSGSETKGSFFQCLEKEEESHDEDYSECFHKPGKKRRLSVDQVQFLEKSFQVENKLEPERKVQLAKEIGLLPRQVAIWFQNRRARYKTKQIEKDYDSLKSSYDKLKSNYDNLLDEKDQLKAVVNGLKGKLLSREKKEELEKPVSSSGNSENVMCKQEDISSTKSDVLDSDSLIENHNSSMVEPAGSSHVFEQDQLSDNFSHDEEDNLSRTLLPVCFPKLEECYYGDEPPANSCNFGFPFEDQTFCFWSY